MVLDADETIISNVEFQATGLSYSRSRWDAWCKKAEATALPGGKEFCALVQELGGKVIIVTNRQGHLQEPTEKNLKELNFPYDLLLTRGGAYADDRSKTMRRRDIEKGEIKTLPAGMKFPPLEIVMLAGDQIHDIYDHGSFDFAKDGARLGEDLIIIPNPMYGSWTRPPLYPSSISGSGSSAKKQPVSETSSGAISPAEAMNREGERVTVESKIVSIYDPLERGGKGPIKLNTGYNYKESLTIIFFDKEGAYGDPARFQGKTIRARGKVGSYKGAVQLTVYSPDDIEIVE